MRIWQALVVFILMAASHVAAEEKYDFVGSLLLPSASPHSIILASDITVATPLDLKRALQRRPDAKVIELASDGGSVYGALLMAVEVHERGLDTYVPEGLGCYSACAYVFFAGANRTLDGVLGVHQISAGDADIGAEATQFTVAAFGIAPGVITAMFRTPPDEMYVFSNIEVAALALERTAPDADIKPNHSTSETENRVASANIDPNALTVVRKSPILTEEARRKSERFVTLQSADTLPNVLSRNGFTLNQSAMMIDALRDTLDTSNIPSSTRLRILYGPLSRESTILVPYRLSIYDYRADGRYDHQVTVALTDTGNYVLGIEPSPIQVSGVTWGTQAPDRQNDKFLSGKSDR